MSSLCKAHVTVLMRQADVSPAKSMLYRKTMWKLPSQLYRPKSPSRSNLVIPTCNYMEKEEYKERIKLNIFLIVMHNGNILLKY